MSPEQAQGIAVDKRSDIWAFGCVLYEMLTGRRAFSGRTLSETMASVVAKEPDWRALPAHTPTAVRRLLRRCLTKDRKHRLADIADARLEFTETLAPARASGDGSWCCLVAMEPRRILPARSAGHSPCASAANAGASWRPSAYRCPCLKRRGLTVPFSCPRTGGVLRPSSVPGRRLGAALDPFARCGTMARDVPRRFLRPAPSSGRLTAGSSAFMPTGSFAKLT